ncbi:allantoicase [Nocardia higoensis]|uniref:allantoicase n=1 Tax=Nocardia higoensis TaxID=228599 RepID=UPI0002F7004B|nr:allantoicase [Nocardia higoensis]
MNSNDSPEVAGFLALPDLAVRSLGGAVVWANDEFFAEREALVRPGDPAYSPATFGAKGQIYDGWETRRRRSPGHDSAIVRLGVPGVIRGVVVDTAWFRGNYPPEISLDGLRADGHPPARELAARDDWVTLVARSSAQGDTRNLYSVEDARTFTHVRLNIFPDGGVARLRVHGEARPDPALLRLGPVDLAALENGAYVTDCSNRFYSAPQNLLMPGPARTMGEGWETARRRDNGNDWVHVRLATEGTIALAEVDTSCFLGNAPGEAEIVGIGKDGATVPLLARTALQPDTRHRFVLASSAPVLEVRLNVYPDGGLARLRLFGAPTEAGWTELEQRWESA